MAREPQMNWITLLETLERQLADTKRAYFTGMKGLTVEDMRSAARRLLTMRRAYEQASGRPATSNPDSGAQVAALLR